MATAWMKVDNYTYALNTKRKRTPKSDSFQSMSENVIELIKKLASKTGKISKRLLVKKDLQTNLYMNQTTITIKLSEIRLSRLLIK